MPEKKAWRPGNMLFPLPAVLVTCADEEGRPNVMTAAWTGTVCSDPAMVYVSIRPDRYSHDIIERTGVYTLNLTTADMARAVDYCGVRSGANEDKFEACGLKTWPGQTVPVPYLDASPVCLECRVTEVKHLGSHDMFLAEVTAVLVDERYMNEKGRFCLEDSNLLSFIHGEYFATGEKCERFGGSVRKKK